MGCNFVSSYAWNYSLTQFAPMKKLVFTLCLAMTMCLADAQINTPAPSPGHEFKQTVGLTEISVDYSRPSMKGRTIYSADGLVPFGQIWRTGANQATTIEFSHDVLFNGKDVKAGKYALYTLPNADKWDVMLYSDLSLGGNTGNYDESNEVVRVSAEPVKMNMSVETFTIDIGQITAHSATLGLIWENTYVPVNIKVHTDKQVDEQIAQFESNPMGQVSANYMNSGWYLYTAGKDKEKALSMLSKGIELSQNPFKYFWMNRKATIQAELGDYAGAIKTAKAAHKNGMNAPENAKGFYENTVKAQLDNSISEWTKKM